MLHQADRMDGGVYQYSLSVIEALMKHEPEDDYVVIGPGGDASNQTQRTDIVSPPQERFSFGGVARKLYAESSRILPIPLPLLIPFRLTRLGRWHRRNTVAKTSEWDLLICPYPTLAGRHMKLPYVVVIHDLMHRYDTVERHPWKEKVFRDVVYKQGAQGSILTVVSSEWSKRELHRLYGIPLDKIRVVPESAPPYLREYKEMTGSEVDLILERFKLPRRYVFYPAQFWRHKNHVGLLKALHRIKKEYQTEVPAVFVGARKQAFTEVMSLANELGLAGQITYLGYVSDKEIVALYKRAAALVMPSLFNASSIPVVEALALGTPCLCANIAPLPEQVGGAGLLFNPHDETDIAEKVWRIWTDDSLRHDLLAKGSERVRERYGPDAFARRWRAIVREAIDISGGRQRLLSDAGAPVEAYK